MKDKAQDLPDRREALLNYAIELVQKSGLAGLTMKKLAAQVGFTETAAYRYFPSKQALLLGLVEKIGNMLLDPVRSIANSKSPPETRVERVLRHHIDFVLKLEGLPMVFLAEAAIAADEKTLASLRSTVGEYLQILGGIIEEMGPVEDGVRSSDAALLLMGIPATLAIRRRIGVDPEAERRARDELLPFVIRCLASAREKRGGRQ